MENNVVLCILYKRKYLTIEPGSLFLPQGNLEVVLSDFLLEGDVSFP